MITCPVCENKIYRIILRTETDVFPSLLWKPGIAKLSYLCPMCKTLLDEECLANIIRQAVTAIISGVDNEAENTTTNPICRLCGKPATLIKWITDAGDNRQAWKCETCNKWLPKAVNK